MPLDTLYIGESPAEEPCAQLGSTEYNRRAFREIQAYRRQILRYYPIRSASCELISKSCPHDFGAYQALFAQYDPESEAATQWAFDIEGDELGVLSNWDAEARKELDLD